MKKEEKRISLRKFFRAQDSDRTFEARKALLLPGKADEHISQVSCKGCGTDYPLTRRESKKFVCPVCERRRRRKFAKEHPKGKYQLATTLRGGRRVRARTNLIPIDVKEPKPRKPHIKGYERRLLREIEEEGTYDDIGTFRKTIAVPNRKDEISHKVNIFGHMGDRRKRLVTVEVFDVGCMHEHALTKCKEGRHRKFDTYKGLSPKRRRNLAKKPDKNKQFTKADKRIPLGAEIKYIGDVRDLNKEAKLRLPRGVKLSDVDGFAHITYHGKPFFIPHQSIGEHSKGCRACLSDWRARRKGLKWFEKEYLPFIGRKSKISALRYDAVDTDVINLVNTNKQSRGIDWNEYAGELRKVYPAIIQPWQERARKKAEHDFYAREVISKELIKTHELVPKKHTSGYTISVLVPKEFIIVKMLKNKPCVKATNGTVYPLSGKRFFKRGREYVLPHKEAVEMVKRGWASYSTKRAEPKKKRKQKVGRKKKPIV